MGCFSFMCKECNQPVLSDSSTGQDVKLFLLNEGQIIERMEGQYDSYGRVFVGTPTNKNDKCIEWDLPWDDVCNLMFDKRKDTGMAAIHAECYHIPPTTKSEDDPNQGWGEEEEEDYYDESDFWDDE